MSKKIIMSLLIMLSSVLLAQFNKIEHVNSYSEGEFYIHKNKLYSTAIVINFKDEVIKPLHGKHEIDITDINEEFLAFYKTLERLNEKFGITKIEKQVPSAEWGKNYIEHRITKQKVKVPDFSQLITIKFNNPCPLDSIIEVLNNLDEVDFVHEPITYTYLEEPDDDYYVSNDQWSLDVINAENAWDITKGLSVRSIGIVDRGTEINHIDIQSKIIDYDAISSSHGTEVAGVAGAVTDNDEGVASLGWNISLNTYSGVGVSNKVADIITATSTSDIINMSWMTTWSVDAIRLGDLCEECTNPDKWAPVLASKSYQEVELAVAAACSAGVICVASAGNSTANNIYGLPETCDPTSPSNYSVIVYPASYSNVIAVSGTELNGSSEEFIDEYNYGDFVDITAPGNGINTTAENGSYASVKGTSFSSPLVAALCGLIKSINSDLTINQVKNILINTADKIDATRYPYTSGWNAYLGYGRINAYEALKYTIENYGGTIGGSGQTVTFHEDITLASTASLTIASGTTVKFNSGKCLFVSGNLAANGATFTHTSGTWDGIEFQSGSNGSINNCTISNASYGLKITNATPTIQNNTISNCDYGLYVYNASPSINSNNINDSRVYFNACNSTLNNNYITGETEGINPPFCSVYVYNSSQTYWSNTIDIQDEYSIVTYNSSLEFGLTGESPPDCGGYNVLDNTPYTDCIIYATNYSDIYLGIGDDQELYDYGYNTILGGSCPLWTDGTSYIDAQWCYWEDGDPAPSCYGNVETDYELDEDPEGGSSLAKSISTSGTISEPQVTFEDSLFNVVFQMIQKKEYESALIALEHIITNYEDTRYAYRAINLALKLNRNQGMDSNEEWLDKISNLVTNDDLAGMIDLKKVSNYQKNGEIDKAITLSEKIPDTRKNKKYEVASLFNLFNFYHKDKENPELARLYLKELKEKYPDNDLTYIARMDMKEKITYDEFEKASPMEAISEEEEIVIPENYALNPVFPNPFNPSTTIEFALPLQSEVECSIFDLRGNLVKEYSFEQNAGTYSIIWNASNVSSGIYLIRFVAEASDGSETFVDYQKVTLLK